MRRICGIILTVVLLSVFGGIFLPHDPEMVRSYLTSFGIAAPISLLVAWVILSCGMFPGTILATTSGMAMGPVWGGLIAILGAAMAAGAACLLARGAGRWVMKHRCSRMEKAQQRMHGQCFRSLLLLRLTGMVPAVPLSYAAGFARAPFVVFVSAMALGGAPRMAAYAMLGSGVGHRGLTIEIVSVCLIVGLSAVSIAVMAWHNRQQVAQGLQRAYNRFVPQAAQA